MNAKVSTCKSPSTKRKSPAKTSSKAPRRKVSTEKACSNESDCISSFILTSTEDYAGLLPLDDIGDSTSQDSSRNDSLLQDGAGGSRSILPDDSITPSEDADRSHGSISGGSSTFPSSQFHSFDDTPKRWNDANLLNTRSRFKPEYPNLSYDSLSSTSPNPSPALPMCPPMYPASSRHPFFQPLPPYSMPHSQSWPPSNQVHVYKIILF